MYWELLEQLRQVDEVSGEEVSPITADDWVTHYRELYKSYEILDFDKENVNELSQYEKE